MEMNSGNTGQACEQRRYYINFDEWAELADKDPGVFEKKRQLLLDEFLSQFPEKRQRRLRGLQFQIDMERRRAKSPLAACIRISDMMWDSVEGENGLLHNFNLLRTDPGTRKPQASINADIIPFPKSQN